MRIERYGASGEKLSQAQMLLFELEPVVSEMIEQAESEHAPVHRSTKESVKFKVPVSRLDEFYKRDVKKKVPPRPDRGCFTN